MKKVFTLFVFAVVCMSCHRNAITGRNQLSLLPESQVQSMSLTEYKTFLSTAKILSPAANKNADMVKRVANRLVTAITQYYTEQGLAGELAGYSWETNLVDSKEVNAWCMPGGKIVVYTGLLPITQNETALAIVMGHEITHALAKHGNERMSEGMLTQLGGMALDMAIANKPAETQNIFKTAYGVGSNVAVILPFSRTNELDADKYGLMYAALAGYDPREAIPFWQRMGQAGGQKPPEFLSTHPTDEHRIEQLQSLMAETMQKYYRPRK